jgi:hypothetical protein
VLVNISGLRVDEVLTENIQLRAYLDLDPAFTQLWHAAEGIPCARGQQQGNWKEYRGHTK